MIPRGSASGLFISSKVVFIFDIKIEKSQLEHYTGIANGVTPMTSIQLIKRYVGLQNKTGILEKVENLKSSFKKWFEENENSNKYNRYMVIASNNLADYVLNYKQNKNVTLKTFSDAELNGFKEIWSGAKKAYHITKVAGKAAIDAAQKEHKKIASGTKVLSAGSKAIFTDKKDSRYSARVKVLKHYSDDNTYKVLFLTLPKGSGWKVNEEDEISAKHLIPGTNENLGFIPSMIAAAAGATVQAVCHHHLTKGKSTLSGAEPEVMSVADAKAETFKEIGFTGDFLKLIGRACAPTSIFVSSN